MGQAIPGCALLANRHLGLAEGVRGLLETTFTTVYIVANAESLLEGTEQLKPALIVLDIALADGGIEPFLNQLRLASPKSRLMVLSVHDHSAAPRLATAGGADAVILKRTIGSDFLLAIDTVMHGGKFISPGFGFQDSESQADLGDQATSSVTHQ